MVVIIGLLLGPRVHNLFILFLLLPSVVENEVDFVDLVSMSDTSFIPLRQKPTIGLQLVVSSDNRHLLWIIEVCLAGSAHLVELRGGKNQ